MGLLSDCKQHFGTENLYELLKVPKTASESEIKKAYRKLSLSVHPDRATDKKLATVRFQTLAKVHFVLSNAEQRSVYDDTGCVEDEDSVFEQNRDWDNYFRTLFPKITKKQVDEFFENYRGSEEERNDLVKAYNTHEGDMDKIAETFIGYEGEHESDYTKLLHDLIKKGEIEAFPAFTKETASKRKKRRQRFEAEAKACEDSGGLEALEKALTQNRVNREANFNSLIAGLEAKYATAEKKKRKK